MRTLNQKVQIDFLYLYNVTFLLVFPSYVLCTILFSKLFLSLLHIGLFNSVNFVHPEAAKKKPKEKKTNKYREKPKKKNRNSDDEALEESDDGDYDDREVDYMTDSTR